MAGAVSRLAEGPRTIRDMAARGEIPGAAKMRGAWSFDIAALDALVSEKEKRPKWSKRSMDGLMEHEAITIKEAVEWIFEGTLSARYLKDEVGVSLGGWRLADGRVLTTIRDAKMFRGSMRFISSTPLEIEGIYVIGYHRFVKIGISNNVKQRITSIQTSIPHKLTTYGILAGQLPQEQALHRRFKKHRLNGEWFRKVGDLAAWIEGGFK